MDQDRLSGGLYKQCFDALLQCDEFNSYESLRAVFVIRELSTCQDGLPQASDKRDLVSKTIAYLLPKRLDDQRPVFPIFLAVLCNLRKCGDALHETLRQLVAWTEQELNGNGKPKAIPVPFVIVAMTRDQASAVLMDTPDHPRCEEFREALQEHGINIANLLGNYREGREDWRPHPPDESTIREIVSEIVDSVNDQRSATGKPEITPTFSSTDFFDEDTRVKTWDRLDQSGCVIIVDAVSMLHPDLRRHLLSSEMGSNERVAMLMLSPVNPCALPVCEFGIGDLRALRRRLFSIVPEVADKVQEQEIKSSHRRSLRKRMGPPSGVGRYAVGQRGG